MNYESRAFYHSWIALPDVQITLRGTTTAREEPLESSDSSVEKKPENFIFLANTSQRVQHVGEHYGPV